MKIAIVPLSLALLLAGCISGDTEDPQEDPATEQPGQGDAARAWKTFHGNYSLVIDKQAPNPVILVGIQNNCVAIHFGQFGRDWYEVRNGTATLTWTPQNPLAETLQLVIFRGGDGYQEEFDGASPIEAGFTSNGTRLKSHYAFSVETALDEFPVQQEVDLRLRFEYVAKVDDPVVDTNASCDLMFP